MAIRIAGRDGRWEWVQALVPYLPCPAPPPPSLYAQHLVYPVYNCTISCCTVAVYSAMTSMFSKWRSPESAAPWASVDVSNCTRVQQTAKQWRRDLRPPQEWNMLQLIAKQLMQQMQQICWFTGTREFQSQKLRVFGEGGVPPHSPPPPLRKTLGGGSSLQNSVARAVQTT